MLDDIFGKPMVRKEFTTCHSGGADGADTAWEDEAVSRGIAVKAYSYRTSSHQSPNKVEISKSDYDEGVAEINKANRRLGRFGISKYMNLLARNWAQVKYSRQIFAIGHIVAAGGKDPKGYRSSAKMETVAGGTGYAVMMGILSEREVYVFCQGKKKWHRWSYNSLRFVELSEVPKITERDFAGIGSRQLTPEGRKAISDVYSATFG